MQAVIPLQAQEEMNDKTPEKGKKQENDRHKRLKQALRANLRRRKADSAGEGSGMVRRSDAIAEVKDTGKH